MKKNLSKKLAINAKEKINFKVKNNNTDEEKSTTGEHYKHNTLGEILADIISGWQFEKSELLITSGGKDIYNPSKAPEIKGNLEKKN